jgi:hypothetical protein
MKVPALFFVRAGALLCALAFAGIRGFADEISVTGSASLGQEKEAVYTLQSWASYQWINVFAATDFGEKWSAGGMLTRGPFSAGGGNLQKPGGLSRLIKPETPGYTTALSAPALTAVGKTATVNHSLPATPLWGGTVQFRPPWIKGSSVEIYGNGKGVVGGDLSLPLNFGAAALRLGTAAYSYPLAVKPAESWFVATPQFADGRYASFLFEASLKYRYGKARKYTDWFLPVVVTAYGGAGLVEYPFGGFDPWFRGDLGVSAGLVSVKGRFYTAPYDFYTPDNRYAAPRTRFAVSPVVNVRLVPSRGILLAAGASLSGDTEEGLYTARAALKGSNGFGAVTATAGLDKWYLDGQGFGASKESAIPVQATAQAIFPVVKATVTGKRKEYVDAALDNKKTEWTVGASAAPRLKGMRWAPAVPAVSASFSDTVYADAEKGDKKSGKVGLKWGGKMKMVKWAGKVEVVW